MTNYVGADLVLRTFCRTTLHLLNARAKGLFRLDLLLLLRLLRFLLLRNRRFLLVISTLLVLLCLLLTTARIFLTLIRQSFALLRLIFALLSTKITLLRLLLRLNFLVRRLLLCFRGLFLLCCFYLFINDVCRFVVFSLGSVARGSVPRSASRGRDCRNHCCYCRVCVVVVGVLA